MHTTDDGAVRTAAALPRWPVALLFGGFPVWWIAGALDMVLIPLAGVMVLHMVGTRFISVPRGFGVWVFFLLLALLSVVRLSELSDLLGFGYRLAVYTSATVLFVYLYNARRNLDARYVCGLLTVTWLTVVAGGYLGVLFPDALVRTPMSFLLPPEITSNSLVNRMVVLRFSQYNPGSGLDLAPRPSAPFPFTNNWGNAYSLLIPLVLAYMAQVRRTRRFALLAIALPLSAVPALLTLNRGMMLGLAIAAMYFAVRMTLRGRPGYLLLIAAAGLVALALFSALPIQERIDTRLSLGGGSNETRASLYQQSIEGVPGSPLLGYGVPQEGQNPNAPPVGTQGQVWLVLVSHGPVALLCFMGWFLIAFVLSLRRRDAIGLAANTSLLVATVELTYYGALAHGIALIMTAAALALRPAPPETAAGPPRVRVDQRRMQSLQGGRL